MKNFFRRAQRTAARQCGSTAVRRCGESHRLLKQSRRASVSPVARPHKHSLPCPVAKNTRRAAAMARPRKSIQKPPRKHISHCTQKPPRILRGGKRYDCYDFLCESFLTDVRCSSPAKSAAMFLRCANQVRKQSNTSRQKSAITKPLVSSPA